MRAAVFLDRDGTVNEEVGYLRDLNDLKLIPGAASAIRKLNESGIAVVLVTNQSGVARGYFSEAFVKETHALLSSMLAQEGARFDGIYYCPHHPTAGESEYTMVCDCRKPATGLLDRAAHDLSIDLHKSFMVGDKWSDVELGHRAGCRSVMVKTGFGSDEAGNKRPLHVKEPEYTAHNLADAVDWIIKQIETEN